MSTFSNLTIKNAGYSIDELVQDARLPSTLHVSSRIAAAVESNYCSLEDIGTILETDIGLSAKVLRIANSPLFMGGGVDTVRSALMYVGLGDIVALVAASEVMGAFEDAPTHENPYEFWYQNLFAATTAQVIARHICLPEGRLFTVGLLRGIGELAIRAALPEEAKKIKLIQCKTKLGLHEIEKEILGFDHAELGAVLLEKWGLPRTLVSPIEFYLNPYIAKEYRVEAAVVNLANYLKNEQYQIPQPPLQNNLIHAKHEQNMSIIEELAPEINRLNSESAKLVMG